MFFANYLRFQHDFSAHGIEYAAEHTLELGMNAVEFLTGVPGKMPTFCDLKEAERTAKVLERYSLGTVCFSTFSSLYGPEAQEAEESYLRYVEIAATLGSPYFHHTLYAPAAIPENPPSYAEMLPVVADSATRITERAKTFGITCLYEPQGFYFNGIAGLAPFFAEMKTRATNVGICGDVGNCLFVDDDPVELFRYFASDIRHLHLKDYFIREEKGNNPISKQSRGGRWLTRTEIGAGDLDLAGAMRILRDVNYCGDISLESNGDDDFMRRSFAYVKDLYREVYKD